MTHCFIDSFLACMYPFYEIGNYFKKLVYTEPKSPSIPDLSAFAARIDVLDNRSIINIMAIQRLEKYMDNYSHHLLWECISCSLKGEIKCAF